METDLYADVSAGALAVAPSGVAPSSDKLNPWELSPWYVRLSAVPDLAMEVGECIAEGELPREIARRFGVKRSQLMLWLRGDAERYAMYLASLQALADEKAMEVLGIADEQAVAYSKNGTPFDPDVGRDGLRIKARMWLASRWDRARYGESDKNVSVGVGVKIVMSREDVGML
jgi:transcriptional regulator with XRE-family HTH domain